MPKWSETKQAAWGEIIVSLAVGGLGTYLNPAIGIPLFVGMLLFGVYLLIRAARSEKLGQNIARSIDATVPTIIKPQKGSLNTVTTQDRLLITGMALRMISIHGHMDLPGLLADRAGGTPLTELTKGGCSDCESPRNKWTKETRDE